MRLILTEKCLNEVNLQKKIEEEWTKGDGYLKGKDFEGNHPWRDWFRNGILGSIYQAEASLSSKNINRRTILEKVKEKFPKQDWKKKEAPPSEGSYEPSGLPR